MGSRLGVIPAAGASSRFEGIYKELLPARDGRSFLWHAANRLPFEQVVVVTSPEKIAMHARELGARAVYAIQRERKDIWGAILMALDFDADRYIFTMPDTIVRDDALVDLPACEFGLGTFQTDMPERFGVIVGQQVINKSAGQSIPATAWGALTWTRRVVELWHELAPETYTQAINFAMARFGFKTWELGDYRDMASIADYLEYMHQ